MRPLERTLLRELTSRLSRFLLFILVAP